MEWFTPEFLNASLFPMGLTAYLVVRMEGTLKKHTDILTMLYAKSEKGGLNE